MDVSSVGVNVGQLFASSKLQQQKDVAILKMANDQLKQDGENAIQLIQSLPQATSDNPVGSLLDVFA
jgi:hypothetical protein